MALAFPLMGKVPTSTMSVMSMSMRRWRRVRRMFLASTRACSLVLTPPGRVVGGGVSVVVVVLVLVVVVVLVVVDEGGVTVVMVVGGTHVAGPVGNGAAPLSIAHVITIGWPAVYCTTKRWLSGTPRLLGPSAGLASSRSWMIAACLASAEVVGG